MIEGFFNCSIMKRAQNKGLAEIYIHNLRDYTEDKYRDVYKRQGEDNIINDSNPLWTLKPSELKDEDYKKFYRDLYPMSDEPLFWIHLNVDYPFHLTGILYFPKVKSKIEPVSYTHLDVYKRQALSFVSGLVKA